MSETNIKIYRNDELIHDCTLCKNPEGRVGWYDAVDGTFHDRADEPAFRKPLFVQYIDTGFYPLNKQGATHIDVGGKWISVEERLPEKSGQYLTYETWVYGWAIYTSYWTNSYQDKSEVEMYGRALWYRYDSEYGDYEVNRITHWMPLPEPPEVDT